MNVEDACDHIPTFDDLPREVNISESTVVGAPVRPYPITAIQELYILLGDYCDSYRFGLGYQWGDHIFHY